ncbi:hypothetical protein BYT27DRAFT_7188857 [Phlegmacium glaucopus]|nr:hypothetical protein BYT27DRAFT_7188857 [Phlegmacium glaucopus]
MFFSKFCMIVLCMIVLASCTPTNNVQRGVIARFKGGPEFFRGVVEEEPARDNSKSD